MKGHGRESLQSAIDSLEEIDLEEITSYLE